MDATSKSNTKVSRITEESRAAGASPQRKPVPLGPVPIHPNFKYHQGPVLNSPVIYSVFIGQNWKSDQDHIQRMRSLQQFLNELPASGFMNVLSQYGCGFGAGNAGCSLQSALHVPDGEKGQPFFELTDRQVREAIQSLIDRGVLPNPGTPPTLGVIVYLANNININDLNDPTPPPHPNVTCISQNSVFGYHDSFTTKKNDFLYYSVVASTTDDCLKNACPPGTQQCHLSFAQTQLERQTMVTSHEFAEMLTDPQGNAWFDDPVDPDPRAEVADICQTDTDPTAVGTISVSGTTWTVQKIYSVTDALAGRDPGVTSAPAPLPRLPFAPVPRRIPIARIHLLQKLANILPLPDIHFDAAQDKAEWDEKDTRAFLHRLVHPYKPTDLVSNLPGFLRHIADVVEKDA